MRKSDDAKAGEELILACELHSVDGIRRALDAGLHVQAPIRGRTPVEWLIEMYPRSDHFAECFRLLLERGAVLNDARVAAVLLNDADALTHAIRADPSLLAHRTSLTVTFTPLIGATLLHVAAEYGHVAVARVLIEMGAEVDARAAIDDDGMNGHTALFHTVNSNGNRSAPVMELLLDAGAQADVRLAGITWGKGFAWETTCFDVTPLSYAQLGLLPQMHRTERDTYANVQRLLQAAGRPLPLLVNVPNRYVYPTPRS